MSARVASWELAERGGSRADELRRKLVRRWRRVPDFASLRARGMVIGSDVAAANGVFLDPGYPWLLRIGDNVGFSLGVAVLTHDASTRRQTGFTRIAPVTIGSHVFVGAHAVILPGVTIGDDVVVAAGAVVAHDVAAGSVVAGVPARVIATTAAWAQGHRDKIERGPTWDRTRLPVGHQADPEEQRAMLAALDEAGGGYVGNGRTR